jgi:ubiquinone biosynthesis protein
VDGDIEIMRHFAGFLEKHVERSRIFDPPALVEDFGRSLRRELDFEWEADQQREFARSLQEVPALIVPRVFHGSESLLVMEYVNGLPVDQPDLLRAAGIAPTAAAEIMSDIVFRMILLTGFFHADPHPGNLAITPQGQLVFYDFGWMGRYSEHFREQLALGLHGLAQHDGNRLTEAVLGMSLTGHVDDPAELQEDLALFSCEYLDCPLAEVNLEETLNRLLEILREHRLHMRSEFYLGVKALCQVEAIARALHPEINYVQFGEPYAKQVLEKKFSLREVGKNLYWGGVELMGFLKELPLELRNVFSRFKKGELQIPVRHEIDPVGFEPLRTTMNHIANRLATALLAAALLITAGLLLHAASKEGGRSLSILGHTALVLGGFLGLRLIWRMWRRGGT